MARRMSRTSLCAPQHRLTIRKPREGAIIDEIISRRNAVERIAKRAGYPDYKAEDLAQEAALQLLENKNLRSQSAKQAFVDSVRGNIERVYNRRGQFVVPVFESHFKDYSSFINAIGCESGLERQQEAKGELLAVISACEVLRPRSREILGLYAQGFTMDEISERIGITESRVHQLIDHARIKVKAKIISDRLSQAEQRRREFEKQKEIPREIQGRSGAQREVQREMEKVCGIQGLGMESFKVPKMPESVFRSF